MKEPVGLRMRERSWCKRRKRKEGGGEAMKSKNNPRSLALATKPSALETARSHFIFHLQCQLRKKARFPFPWPPAFLGVCFLWRPPEETKKSTTCFLMVSRHILFSVAVATAFMFIFVGFFFKTLFTLKWQKKLTNFVWIIQVDGVVQRLSYRKNIVGF